MSSGHMEIISRQIAMHSNHLEMDHNYLDMDSTPPGDGL